jgi:hypothetical protein
MTYCTYVVADIHRPTFLFAGCDGSVDAGRGGPHSRIVTDSLDPVRGSLSAGYAGSIAGGNGCFGGCDGSLAGCSDSLTSVMAHK